MNAAQGTTLCTRCGAPIPWDGVSKTVTCPYCHTVVVANAVGPRGGAARMPRPGGGGAAAGAAGIVVFVVLGVLGLFLVGGGVAGWLLFRSSAPMPAPAPVIAVTAPTSLGGTTITTGKKAAAEGPPVVVTFGSTGNAAGQLTDARAIAVDMDENVYVADYDTLRVQKFDKTGKFQWIIEVTKDAFAGNKTIFGLAADTKGTLWVARRGDLLKYATADGKAQGLVKGNYDNMWFRGVALDPVGNIATTHDAAGDTDLLLLDPNGKLKKRVKNKQAEGFTMDGVGNVYLTDRYDGTIEVLDAKGEVKSKFGSKTDKHTTGIQSIAVDGKGHIFASVNEGINVFDQGGGFLETLRIKIGGAVRDFALGGPASAHLFVLGNDKVTEFDVSAVGAGASTPK